MESLDGLMLTKDRRLVFLQITVAKSHGVKVRGLRDVYERFKSLVDSCMLVFVVPSSSAIAKVQPLLNQEGKVWRKNSMNSPITRLQSEQFVLKFDAFDLKIKKQESS